ncbi:hypothetical protein [Nocardia sp. NPDC059229]|uniref:hypothetical protein n=1 Tax=Nocardia sp. NPDC059229 TaxID=3346778 RepID=UPI0036AC6A8B
MYYTGVRTRYGWTRPSPEQIALEVFGPSGVGPTGYSAARALGLTTQIPVAPGLAVTHRIRTAVAGVKTSSRTNRLRHGLRYEEIAVLELLRNDEWRSVVDAGWPALVDAAACAVEAGRIRPAALSACAHGERSLALRANLSRLLATLRSGP